jgi:hypothetical protein
MSKHYLHETGSDLIFDTGVNIGTASTYYIEVKRPNGLVGTFTASLYSSYSELAQATGTYFLKHTLAYNDFDVSGKWKFQAFVAAVDGTWWGERAVENIFDKFE